MIRTLIIPDNGRVTIDLPQNYVGKQVEVIAFTLDETASGKDGPITPFASEKALEKEWLTQSEDKAWLDL